MTGSPLQARLGHLSPHLAPLRWLIFSCLLSEDDFIAALVAPDDVEVGQKREENGAAKSSSLLHLADLLSGQAFDGLLVRIVVQPVPESLD